MTNTQRTLKYCRELGLLCAMSEHWNPFAKIRQDLFGIIDIVGLGKGAIYGVQSCADSGRSAHRKKLLSSPCSLRWLEAGGILWLISWGKHKTDGRAERWMPFVEPITKLQIEKYRLENPEGPKCLQ